MDESPDEGQTIWLLFPAPVRRLPVDLAAIAALTVCLFVTLVFPPLRDSPLQGLFGVPFVLFIPGYLLVSALFPEQSVDETASDEAVDGLSNLARFGLSFPASVMVVAPLGLVAVFTPWGLQLTTVFPLLTVYVLGMVWLTARRRAALPEDARFQPPVASWVESAQQRFTEGSTTDIALNVLLAMSIVAATTAVAYGLVVPPAGEPFTEMYLTPVDSDRQVPNATLDLADGETASLQMTVRNQEQQRVQYDLLVIRQRVQIRNDSVTVLTSSVTDRYEPTLAHNDTWREIHTISVPTGTGLYRVAYLLYKNDPPSNPTIENAYRQNNLFVNATM